jgi:hypothetical protein
MRTYHIDLQSTGEGRKWYTRVAWNYDDAAGSTRPPRECVGPARALASQASAARARCDTRAPMRAATSSPRGIDLAHMKVAYVIEGDADFRPTQVFDDGTHTYIRLPERLQELPALFMLTPDTGETALVNYAVSEPYLIVQRTMERFLLQLGKAKVTVRRGVKRGFWSFLESSSRAAGAGEGRRAMSSATFVSPRAYQTPGGVPRRMLAGIVVVLTCIALALYWLAGGEREAHKSADARARDRLASADALEALPRGSARSVDDAERCGAGLAARGEAGGRRGGERRRRRCARDRDPESGEGLARPGDRRVAAGDWRSARTQSAADGASPVDVGFAARELEARSGEGRIFDGTAPRTEAPAPAQVPATDAMSAALAALPRPRRSRRPWPARPAIRSVCRSRRYRGRLEAPRAGARARHRPAQRAVAGAGRRAGAGGRDRRAPGRRPAGDLRRNGDPRRPHASHRSDSPGIVTAMVSMDVYDSRTARTLLLPKGARLVGRYNDDVTAGHERLQFAFTRLILPDGASFDLPGAIGSDAAGQGGSMRTSIGTSSAPSAPLCLSACWPIASSLRRRCRPQASTAPVSPPRAR